MSASLVGSEMCIRDRLRKEPYGVPPKPKAAGPPVEGGEKRGAPLPGTPPVSYTHLTLPTICSV
eukprot:2057632-Alexandrium_andersonii.AAC.1